MFITQDDFKVVASDNTLKIISQADDINIDNAIEEAIEEVAGYLRPIYDTKQIFSSQGDNRNKQLVMFTADIALYNMAASMPQRMGIDVRKERYDRAIKWLEGVQSGKIVPDIPYNSDDTTSTSSFGVLAYGNGPNRHSW